MNTSRLPGIVRIHIVRCAHLPAYLTLKSLSGSFVAIAAPATAVSFCGRPTLVCENSFVNGRPQATVTLEFKTATPLPEGVHLAFVVTLADRRQLLIGTREPNYPQVSWQESAGNPGGEAAVRTYKIKHIAVKSALPCVL